MKHRLLLPLLLLGAAGTTARAAIDYSGVQNIAIPLDIDGVFFRFDTGAIAFSEPVDFNTAPWVNPFFGGTGIYNGDLFRPVITGADQVLNLAPGTVIGGASNFVADESVSSTHVGVGAGQFLLDTPGYLGATFKTSIGGPDYYAWIHVELNNDGPGKIISWAFEDVSGASILAGDIGPVPEPGTAFFGLGVALAALARRVRSRR